MYSVTHLMPDTVNLRIRKRKKSRVNNLNRPIVLCSSLDPKFQTWTSETEAQLRTYFTLVVCDDLENETIASAVQGAMVNPWSYLWFKLYVKKLTNLKVVATSSLEYDHLRLLKIPHGVKLANAPYVGPILNTAVADMGMTLLLAAGRKLVQGVKKAMAPETTVNYSGLRLGQEITGMTLGIVGMGRIGMEVAKRAYCGFGMKVLYHNRSQRCPEDEKSVNAEYFSKLLDMLPLCDYVMIVCPLSQETENMITAKQFRAMKPTAHLINIARGAIVDHDALSEALYNGEIDGAALDVTYPQPLPREHPLLKHPNVIINAHQGSATKQTREKMWQLTVDNLVACLIDKKPMPGELILNGK